MPSTPPIETQRRRVLTSAGIGLLSGLVVAVFAPWQLAVLAGWDVAAVIVCLRVWTRVGRFTPQQTRALATFEDDSRPLAELLLVSASVASLVGVAFGIVKAHESARVLDVILALLVNVIASLVK